MPARNGHGAGISWKVSRWLWITRSPHAECRPPSLPSSASGFCHATPLVEEKMLEVDRLGWGVMELLGRHERSPRVGRHEVGRLECGCHNVSELVRAGQVEAATEALRLGVVSAEWVRDQLGPRGVIRYPDETQRRRWWEWWGK